jgi:hypothetical protein
MGPADQQPPDTKFSVQVKSTEDRDPTTRVKLSNMVKMGKDARPWFLVLYHYPRNGEHRIYAKHLWRDFMETGLRAVREAESKRKRLNRTVMAIAFSAEDDHTDDLFAWMEAEIAALPNYEHEKKRLYQTVGFEGGSGTAIVQFEAVDQRAFAKAFVGVGPGLQVRRFEFTPERFGIPAARPNLSFGTGVLQIDPLEEEPCDLRLRVEGVATPLFLPGRLIRSGIPDGALLKAFRVASDFIDVIYFQDGICEFSLSIDESKPFGLRALRDYTTIRDWLRREAVGIEIADRHGRRIRGTIKPDQTEHFDWSVLAITLDYLGTIAPHSVEAALRDVFRTGKELVIFERSTSGAAVALEYPETGAFKPDVERLVYFAAAQLGSHSCFALVSRLMVENQVKGDTRRLEFGPALVHDQWMRPLELDQDERRQLQLAEYRRFLDDLEGTCIGLGDIVEFAKDGDNRTVTVEVRKDAGRLAMTLAS